MPLRFATEPGNGPALVREGLGRAAARQSPLSGSQIDFAALELSPPHPVYDLRADAVADGAGLESATLSGYRYLVIGQGDAVAAAEIPPDATRLSNINYGPYVGATQQALTDVNDLPAVGAASYEVRVLRLAAIYLMALWLKAEADGADIIYPMAPAPTGLQAGTAYSAEEFLGAIRPLAQARVPKTGGSPVP
jgi:hypothetical protein